MLGFRRFLLDPDEGLGGGEVTEGTGAEEMETAEPSEESGAEETETAEPSDEKSDRAFAEMRRKLEEAQKQISELESMNADYEEALGHWFDGDNKAAQAIAHYEDIPLEEAMRNMEQKREANKLAEEKKALEDELQQLRYESMKAKDLEEIRTKYPDTDLRDVEKLGDDFFAYRAMGIDAVTAYDAIQLKKGVPPKPMGKAKTSAPQKTGGFTQEEVRAMTPSQISKNFDKIRESMSKW